MNVLVVGGAGYVGGVVTDLLMNSEHDVRVFDSLLYEEVFRKPVDFVYGDVRDYKLLQILKWIERVQRVIKHCPTQHGHKRFGSVLPVITQPGSLTRGNYAAYDFHVIYPATF